MFHRRPDRPPRPHRRRPGARRRAEKVRQDADKLLYQGDHGGGDEGREDTAACWPAARAWPAFISDGQITAQRGETLPCPLPVPARDDYATVAADARTWRSLTRPLDNAGDRLEALQDLTKAGPAYRTAHPQDTGLSSDTCR